MRFTFNNRQRFIVVSKITNFIDSQCYQFWSKYLSRSLCMKMYVYVWKGKENPFVLESQAKSWRAVELMRIKSAYLRVQSDASEVRREGCTRG